MARGPFFSVNTNLQLIPWRAVRLLSAAIAVFAMFAVTAHASNRWATLEAIHRLENPYDLTRPGPFGELGAYQFREETWRMHTSVPFRRALDRRASDDIAVKHYEWLKQNLENAGVRATPYMIALAWNGGLDGAVRGTAPAAARDYAERAANIASTLGADRMIVAVR